MELRNRITKEATHQFFQYGIRNVTMEDIAVSLGISKRTIYETFKDKKELIQTCLEHLSEEQDGLTQTILEGSGNVVEAIFAFMQLKIKAIDSIHPAFLKDLKKYYPWIFNRLHSAHTEKGHDLSRRFLETGIQEGIFRKEINVAIIVKLFFAQMNLIAGENLFSRNEYDLKDILKNMVINYMRGISTKRGIDLIDDMTNKL
jgi:TetR/AcrR family transcriptional regulator, cholesterol catabolism regulator